MTEMRPSAPSRGMPDYLLVMVDEHRGDCLWGVVGDVSLAGQRPAFGVIRLGRLGKTRSKPGDRRRHHPAPLGCDDLGNATDIRRQDGPAVRHALGGCQAESLGTDRRHDCHRRLLHEGGYLLPLETTMDVYPGVACGS